MQEHIIEDSAEADSIAQEFAEANHISDAEVRRMAKNWFEVGCSSEGTREALTVDSLKSKLTHSFLVRKD